MTQGELPKKLKRLAICPQCGGYMQPDAPVRGAPVGARWDHHTQHRSFGGVTLQKFVCENPKCGFVETMQIDDFYGIEEDD